MSDEANALAQIHRRIAGTWLMTVVGGPGANAVSGPAGADIRSGEHKLRWCDEHGGGDRADQWRVVCPGVSGT